MITKLITLAIIGVACGLIQRSTINRSKEVGNEEGPVEETASDRLRNAFTIFTLGMSAGAFTNLLITLGLLVLSVILSPLTIPALLFSVWARAAYIGVINSLMASLMFVLGNTLGYKLNARKESI